MFIYVVLYLLVSLTAARNNPRFYSLPSGDGEFVIKSEENLTHVYFTYFVDEGEGDVVNAISSEGGYWNGFVKNLKPQHHMTYFASLYALDGVDITSKQEWRPGKKV